MREVTTELLERTRLRAIGMILTGVFKILFGLIIVSIIFGDSKPGEAYLILDGLIIWAISDICLGLYRFIYPKSIVRKAK